MKAVAVAQEPGLQAWLTILHRSLHSKRAHAERVARTATILELENRSNKTRAFRCAPPISHLGPGATGTYRAPSKSHR